VKALVIAFSLLGTGVLWGWALLGKQEPPVLPAELCGTFELFAFVPSPDSPENPLTSGHTMRYEFDKDCTYVLRILLDGGHEMARFAGTIDPVAKDEVALTGVAENAVAVEGVTERFRVIWAYDEKGEYLNLTNLRAEGEGRQLLLRRVEG